MQSKVCREIRITICNISVPTLVSLQGRGHYYIYLGDWPRPSLNIWAGRRDDD
jgi:hypothetical protein